MHYSLEASVGSVESAVAAASGGATRLELSQNNLILGGTTPSLELFKIVKRCVDLPIIVLIRPRFGDFFYTDYEFEQMLMEIESFKSEGAFGISAGVLEANGRLDSVRMKKLVQAADGMYFSLNRAFDLSNSPFESLETVRKLGINSVRTSGQKNTALEGMALLEVLNDNVYGIEIVAAGNIDRNAISVFLERTKLRVFQVTGKTINESKMLYRNLNINLAIEGIHEYQSYITDEAKIFEAATLLKNHIRNN